MLATRVGDSRERQPQASEVRQAAQVGQALVPHVRSAEEEHLQVFEPGQRDQACIGDARALERQPFQTLERF